MEKAIKIAIDNGYSRQTTTGNFSLPMKVNTEFDIWEYDINAILLDPLFWEALGKGLGWNRKYINQYGEVEEVNTGENVEDYMCQLDTPIWKDEWHHLIDHLAQGKDIDSFFNNLIN